MPGSRRTWPAASVARLAVEAMREAGASYRAWAPIVVLPWLLEETMAKAAALAGVDWSEEIAEGIASRTEPRPTSVMGRAGPKSGGGERRPSRDRRRAIAAAGLAALLLGGGVAAALVAGEPTPISPRLVADTHRPKSPRGSNRSHPKRQKHRPRSHGTARTDTTTQEATTVVSPLPPVEAGEGGAPGETDGGPGRSPSGVGRPATGGDRRPQAQAHSETRVAARARPGSPGRNPGARGTGGRRSRAGIPVKRKSERERKGTPRPGALTQAGVREAT